MCRPVLKTLILLQTKIYDFPYPISDLTLKCIPYFRPCDVWQIRQLSTDLRRTGLRDAPNDFRVFFFAINVHGSTRYSKNGILEKYSHIFPIWGRYARQGVIFRVLSLTLTGYTMSNLCVLNRVFPANLLLFSPFDHILIFADFVRFVEMRENANLCTVFSVLNTVMLCPVLNRVRNYSSFS